MVPRSWDIHSYLPYLQEQPSSGLGSRGPSISWGLCPWSLGPLGWAVTVLMVPFPLGLWFRDESRAQSHGLLGTHEENSRKQLRPFRATLSCPLINPTTPLAPCPKVFLAPRWAGTGLRRGRALAHLAYHLLPPDSSVVFSLQRLAQKLEWAPERARWLGAPLGVFCLVQRCFTDLPIIAGMDGKSESALGTVISKWASGYRPRLESGL